MCCFVLPVRMSPRLLNGRVLKRLPMRRRAVLACRRWCSRSIMAACWCFALPFSITSASSPSWCFRFWMARRWMSFLHPVAKGWAPFASIAAWPSWNPRLTTKQSLRCARLSAMRSVANTAAATRSMPFAICRQTPARCGAMRLRGWETPSAPLSSRFSMRI